MDTQSALERFSDLLPADDEEAAELYSRWGCRDPFFNDIGEIPPALLNSADILSYVAATGMIYPFHADVEHLHPASYAVPLEGTCIRWRRDKLHTKRVKNIERGQEFYLPQDSIAFLTLEPALRIPDYLALRFNLRVDNAYRGLLLGTGPLVDPGFQGRLSIPLHNFTTNDYVFTGGDRIIWLEFTKLSPQSNWSPDFGTNPKIDATGEKGRLRKIRQASVFVRYELSHYEEDPVDQTPYSKQKMERKKLSTVNDYLKEAAPHSPVFSSTRHALDTAEKAWTRFKQIGIFGALATFALIVFAVVPLWWMRFDYKTRVDELETEIEQLRSESSASETQASDQSQASKPSRLSADTTS